MSSRGFTYIELIITVAILAILASVVMPLSQLAAKRSKEFELRENLRVIRTAIEEYKRAWDEGKIKRSFGESGYPPDLFTLVNGVDNVQLVQSGLKIRFLRRIPRDPMHRDKTMDPADTWGLRSYQSEPDDPREGNDVYDVHSRSDEQAIDGTYYRDW